MAANTELIAIELQLKGYDGVMSDFRTLDTMLHSFRSGKNKITIESNLAQAKKELIAYDAEVKKLQKDLANVDKGSDAWKETNSALDTAKQNLSDTRKKVQELQYALRNLTKESFKQTFDKISSSVAHAGSAMQSMGNALTRLTSPFRRFTTGLIAGAGYKALNMLTSGFSGAFERYDTMNNYAKSLNALGLEADKTFKVFANQDKAMTAIENLNESVLGLPTGLDEIAAAQKVYAGATGEMEKSTKIAIAANNTFLASAMDSRNQRFMQRYLTALASGADLTTTQWQSMARIAPLAMRAVSEELGYASDAYAQFNNDVQKGIVSGQEFLDAFVAVGTNGKVQAAANVMKTTWEGLSANIQNATKRMGEGILKSIDMVMETYNGRNLVQNLLGFDAQGNEVGGGIKHFINDISESVQNWIKSHPEEIIQFFDDLKSFDLKGLLKGVGEGMLTFAKGVQNLAKMFGGMNMERIGKFMVYGQWLGRFLTITGGLLKGSRHIIAFFGAGGIQTLRTLNDISKAGGLLNWLGKGLIVGENATDATRTIDTVAKSAPKMGRFSTALSAVFKGWGQIATMIGGSAVLAWGTVKVFKSTMKNFGEMIDIVKEIDWRTGAKALTGIGIFLGAMAGLSKLAGAHIAGGVEILFGEAVVGAITSLALGFAALDMHIIKSGFKAMADTTKYLNEAIDSLKKVASVEDVSGVKYKVQNAITLFNQIINLFQEDNIDPKMQTTGSSKLKTMSKTVRDTVKYFSESISMVKDSIGTINDLNTMELQMENVESLMGSFEGAMNTISSAIDNIDMSLGKKGTLNRVSNMSGVANNLKTALESLVGDNGVLAQIPEFTNKMYSLMRNRNLSDFTNLTKKFGEIVKDTYTNLTQGITGSGDMLKRVENFADAMEAVKRALETIGSIDTSSVNVDSGMEKVNSMIESIKTSFGEDKISEVTAQIDTFVTAVREALNTFNEFNEDIEVNPKVKLGKDFKSSVTSTASQIRGANTTIANAVNGIQLNYSRRIRLTLTVSAIVNGINATKRVAQNAVNDVLSSYPQSTGGLTTRHGVLYRSKGGSVFKPRGTDRIPAMLTEGEYVHRKQAVDYFGADFMQKINAMDVRGAMQALMAKAGTSMNPSRSSVVNNTVNNNQRITQNINTNNPNFAGVRMGRYVGAL